MRRRPPPRRSGAVVHLLAGCLLLLASSGCSGNVSVDAPRVTGASARACSQLVHALPSRVADQRRREVDAGNGYAAAWGDPAIELRCGVPRPEGFDKFSQCQRVNGVDWFIPESQQTGKPTDITVTTVGRRPDVEVRLPEDYWPPATAMADLAGVVKKHLREVKPCH
jgi:Protein of unknown function (DUF3515)